VKTVMSEQGKAMMGTATVEGADRARLAAEQAVSSPLLEGVDLSGARGVLVNITASRSLKLSETKQVMNTIRSYAAKEATVIFGSVYSEECGDALRVTVVATGLGANDAKNTDGFQQASSGSTNPQMAPPAMYHTQVQMQHVPHINQVNHVLANHAGNSNHSANSANATHSNLNSNHSLNTANPAFNTQSFYSGMYSAQGNQGVQNFQGAGIPAPSSSDYLAAQNTYNSQNTPTNHFSHTQNSQIIGAQNQQNSQTASYYAGHTANNPAAHSNLAPQGSLNTEEPQSFSAPAASASLWNAQINHGDKRTIFEEQTTASPESTSDIYDIPAFLRRQTSDAN
jgi:hypothetical protein